MTERKVKRNFLILIIVIALLIGVTFAVAYVAVRVDNNIYRTGEVKINLNDGNPIIGESEFLFEPGATLKKEFFVENQSTWSVWYKIYLENVSGELADAIRVKLTDGDDVLFEGTMRELSDGSNASNRELKVLEKRTLTIYLTCMDDVGNVMQGQSVSFDIKAVCVQTKNNPDRKFE